MYHLLLKRIYSKSKSKSKSESSGNGKEAGEFRPGIGIETVDTHTKVQYKDKFKSKDSCPLKWCLITGISPIFNGKDSTDGADGTDSGNNHNNHNNNNGKSVYDCIWQDSNNSNNTNNTNTPNTTTNPKYTNIINTNTTNTNTTTTTNYIIKQLCQQVSFKIGFESQSQLDLLYDALLPI